MSVSFCSGCGLDFDKPERICRGCCSKVDGPRCKACRRVDAHKAETKRIIENLVTFTERQKNMLLTELDLVVQ